MAPERAQIQRSSFGDCSLWPVVGSVCGESEMSVSFQVLTGA